MSVKVFRCRMKIDREDWLIDWHLAHLSDWKGETYPPNVPFQSGTSFNYGKPRGTNDQASKCNVTTLITSSYEKCWIDCSRRHFGSMTIMFFLNMKCVASFNLCKPINNCPWLMRFILIVTITNNIAHYFLPLWMHHTVTNTQMMMS